MSQPLSTSLNNNALTVSDIPSSNEEGADLRPALSPQEAWANVFTPNFNLAEAASSFDVLAQSLMEPILDDQARPVDRAAKLSTGSQMAFIASVFEKAVSIRRMENFPEGSLGKMALIAGNVQGALDAARAKPELHQGMRDSQQVTLFVQAMIQGELDLMRSLTSRENDAPLIDPFYTNKQGFNYLYGYLKKAPELSLEVIQAFSACLIDSKNLADESASLYQRYLSASDPYGKTALHTLAMRMREPKLEDQSFIDVFAWFNDRIDINTPDKNDETALHVASQFNRVIVNTALLKMGALLEWITHTGRTALNIAAYHGHSELVKAYLDHDIKAANTDPSIKQGASDGPRLRVPLIAARNHHWAALTEYLKHSNEGVNQHEATDDAHTPLILAVKAVDHAAVTALVKAGADVNVTNGHGYTAVHYAAHQFTGALGDAPQRILFDLLANGGSLAIADNGGSTALDIIIQRSDIDSSEELFFTINTSLLSEWVFKGDRQKTEQFLDQSEALNHASQAVLRKTHPLIKKAEKWLNSHEDALNREKRGKVKQARSDLIGIMVDTLSYSGVLLSLADVDVNPMIKNMFEMIPKDYQIPTLGAAGFVLALARATEFRGDLTKFKNIGSAADAMAGKILRNVLRPVGKAITRCTTGEQGPLGHVYRYFRGMRESCKRISMACKAFVQVLRRPDLKSASPAEIVDCLDQEVINAVGAMTHQDFQKFRGQARLNARQGHQEHDSPGMGG
jgi:ankyrin repeat protein